MNTVNINVIGNGTAWVDVEHPLVGQDFTLHCRPDENEHLLDVTCRDEGGHAIAATTGLDVTYTWSSAWIGTNIYFTVTFTGTPTPPTPTTRINIAVLQAAKRRKNKRIFI